MTRQKPVLERYKGVFGFLPSRFMKATLTYNAGLCKNISACLLSVGNYSYFLLNFNYFEVREWLASYIHMYLERFACLLSCFHRIVRVCILSPILLVFVEGNCMTVYEA